MVMNGIGLMGGAWIFCFNFYGVGLVGGLMGL